MKVVALKVKDEDEYVHYLSKLMIDKRNGVIGEYAMGGSMAKISILGERVRELIDEEELEGLCKFKFYENITIRNFEIEDLQIESRYKIGDTIVEVVYTGKRCFAECKLLEYRDECDLFTHIVFTRVIKGGIVMIDDIVKKIK